MHMSLAYTYRWVLLVSIALLSVAVAVIYSISRPHPTPIQPLKEDARVMPTTNSSTRAPSQIQPPTTTTNAGLTPNNQAWDSFATLDAPRALRPSTAQPSTPTPNTSTRPTYTPRAETAYTPLVAPQNESYHVPGLTPAHTASDTDIYKAYGNTAGAVIQSAVAAMGNQNTTLLAFVTNLTDTSPVTSLAEQYRALARKIETLDHPQVFKKNAAELVAGYEEVGRGLDTLATASKDTVYTHLLSYNSTVETFAESFVPYASLFGALGITFSPDEPGGIFTPAVQGF